MPGFLNRTSWTYSIGVTLLTVCFVGCAMQQPKRKQVTTRKAIANPASLQMVKDLARPWGLNWVEGQTVSLTVGLPRTGSDPAPSAEREMIVQEMQKRDVHDPDSVLRSPATALTLVRGMIPPGAQKGDRIDLEVRVPRRSETESLEGGWLMLSRLEEYAKLNNRLSRGHLLALGQGSILVDSLVEGGSDPVFKTRGRVLGGGVVSRSRMLGLRLRDEHLSAKTSAKIGLEINKRFHIYDQGDRRGVATPKRDTFVEIALHPRYRENIVRYMRVIENIPIRESSRELVDRLHTLKSQLMNPQTSSEAAVMLEAIGADGIPVLKEGLASPNPEVRFYSAEGLAYMDIPEAAAELAYAIRGEAAFRQRGFAALGAMDDMAAQDELLALLNERSAEARYGAFRTLRKMTPDDPMLSGEALGDQCSFHLISSSADPLVHVAKFERPEIVIFGGPVPLQSPVQIFTGKSLSIRDSAAGKLRIRKISADDEDQQQVVPADLESLIRGMVDMGGTYSEIVQAISLAKKHRCLECRVEYSAISRANRKYRRRPDDQWADEATEDGPSDDGQAIEMVISDDQASAQLNDLGVDDFGIDTSLGMGEQTSVDNRGLSDMTTDDIRNHPVSIVDEDDMSGLILFNDDEQPATTTGTSDGLAPVIDAIRP